jgi:hypothetical protein
MTAEQPSSTIPFNKTLLLTGAALIASGGLLAAAGIGCAAYVAVTAARAWSRQLPTPPNEVARRKLTQARAAREAATQAWRDGTTVG